MVSILKVDSLTEKTVGQGINLQHSLNNSSGDELLSAAGALSETDLNIEREKLRAEIQDIDWNSLG